MNNSFVVICEAREQPRAGQKSIVTLSEHYIGLIRSVCDSCKNCHQSGVELTNTSHDPSNRIVKWADHMVEVYYLGNVHVTQETTTRTR